MEFFCTDEMCPFEGGGPFTIEIPQEACVDVHNIASIFCPYCNNMLSPKVEEGPESHTASETDKKVVKTCCPA